MKLLKKELEEVTGIYDTWMHSYLNGDVKTYDSFFDDNYHFIGSTSNEDFLNRKDTTRFFKDTADQLAGKVEIRNNQRTIEKFDGLIFITERFDAYFRIEGEWSYYGKFRFTSALQKKPEGWRFIYQHFSTPDSKAQEGETIGTEQIAAENRMLRDAVKRRTIELEQKNRELEIEAALERVRARSMGMHKSEELVEVVRLLDKEINGLGVDLNGSQIVTDFANPEDGVNDWYAREGQDYLEKFHIPYLEHPLTKRLYNALHQGVGFYTENYSKAEKNKYFRLLFKYSDFRKTSKERQEFVYHSPAWIRAVVVSKNSVLVFQRFDLKEFTKEEEEIFKRFGKVFEQAYTRFLDLQKAEAQPREAKLKQPLNGSEAVPWPCVILLSYRM